jgi:predicted transcriptional regulator
LDLVILVRLQAPEPLKNREREQGNGTARHNGVDAGGVAAVRDAGRSWREIADELGIPAGTARSAYQRLAKNGQKVPAATV